MVQIRHKVNIVTPGLKALPEILIAEYFTASRHTGEYLRGKVRAKQRIDTGQERRRTDFRIKQSKRGNFVVSVSNTVVQALVDETGATWRSKIPPWRAGSKLFRWAQRKGLVRSLGGGQAKAIASFVRKQARADGANKQEARQAGRDAVKDTESRINAGAEWQVHKLAVRIAERGLPRPGDPLRKPFETTRKQEAKVVRELYISATQRAIKKSNQIR